MVKDMQVRLKKDIKDALKQRKIYRRESYSDIIKRLIDKDKKKVKGGGY